MRLVAAIGITVGISLWPLGAIAQSAARVCPAQLGAVVEAIAAQPPLQRTRWGIVVQELDTGVTLYDREAQQYFIPASNAKLLSTAAALTYLGPQFQIQTTIMQEPMAPTPLEAAGEATAPVDLHLIGRGDPSVTDAQLHQLAQQLRERGLTQVRRLTVHDRYWGDSPIHPNWEWEDVQAGYGAPVSSVMLNGNALAYRLSPQGPGDPLRFEWVDAVEGRYWPVDNQSRTVVDPAPEFVTLEWDLSRPQLRIRGQLRAGGAADTGELAIPDPTGYFMRHLRQSFTDAGITVTALSVGMDAPPPNAVEVAAIASPPLSDLLLEANQASNNLYAESLVQTLGVLYPHPNRPPSSREAGLLATEAILSGLGVEAEGYALADGSGLSRHNLVSPLAIAQTLRGMARSPLAQVYRRSLAVAGVSGTLRSRFVDTPVAGRLQGKTGAMGGVAALSGYLDPPQYEPLVFSILVNHFDQPVRSVRPVMDAIVTQLALLQHCP